MAGIAARLRGFVRKIKVGLLFWLVKRSPARPLIEAGIERWAQMNDSSHPEAPLSEKLQALLYADHLEEFRNLLYYRLEPGTSGMARVLLGLSMRLFPPRSSIAITCPSIAPGLIIKHGLDTVIDAEKVGENCMIFQDVFIGMKDRKKERPTLGNYVHVSTGARLLGKITIGDHSVIAANAVVTRDMPPNSLAMGIPAKIVLDAGNLAEYVANGMIPAPPPDQENQGQTAVIVPETSNALG